MATIVTVKCFIVKNLLSLSRSLQVLANYWKNLSSIDINIWPHWLHTYKIPLVLNQDSPLPSHLLHPSESGRYSSIQCRVAASKLFAFLRNWSTLVLLENHSYVKLLPDETIPQHLCLVRVAQMHPCLIVHVGFLEGTPKQFQQEIISSLKETISELKIPLPLLQSSKQSSSRKKTSSILEQPCAVIINKQLQKALISYDFPLGDEVPVQWQYMPHHRWQWKVPQTHPVLLTGLLQRRLREGFLIASAHNGIVTLVAELNVKVIMSFCGCGCIVFLWVWLHCIVSLFVGVVTLYSFLKLINGLSSMILIIVHVR